MEQNSNPIGLCTMGCGFYGNHLYEGMCSKCFKRNVKRQKQCSLATGRNTPGNGEYVASSNMEKGADLLNGNVLSHNGGVLQEVTLHPSAFANITQNTNDIMNTEVIIKLEEDDGYFLNEDITLQTAVQLANTATQEHDYVSFQQRAEGEANENNYLVENTWHQGKPEITVKLEDDYEENICTQDGGVNADVAIVSNELFGNKAIKVRYKCDLCDKDFTQKSGLKRHLSVHSGQKRYACEICNKQFYRHWNLVRHSSQHSAVKQVVKKEYRCTVCDKYYATNSNLKTHMLLHTKRDLYKCTECEKEFTQKSSLIHHSVVHTGKKLFECSLCCKKFTQKAGLTRHLRVHTGEKRYKCSYCEKSFFRHWNLLRHTSNHTGEQKSVCAICGKHFSNLTAHMIVHTRGNVFKCVSCDEEFARKVDLVQHGAVHSGSKLYDCIVCDKKFTQKAGMRRHVKAHFGVKPHKCDICSKGFVRHWNLLRHSATHKNGSRNGVTQGYTEQHLNVHTVTDSTVTDDALSDDPLDYLLTSNATWISNEQLRDHSLYSSFMMNSNSNVCE